MSMNLHLKYSEDFPSLKLNRILTFVDRFNLWQTPTDVSYEVRVKGDNKETLNRYIQWVKDIDENGRRKHRLENIAKNRASLNDPNFTSTSIEVKDHLKTLKEFIDKYGIDNVEFWIS